MREGRRVESRKLSLLLVGFGSHDGLVVDLGVGLLSSLHSFDIGEDDGDVELGEEDRNCDGAESTSDSLREEREERERSARDESGRINDKVATNQSNVGPGDEKEGED